MRLTRRQMVAALAPAAAMAQAPAAPPAPASELKAAEARLQANSEALSKLEVPMDTEPAFQFRP